MCPPQAITAVEVPAAPPPTPPVEATDPALSALEVHGRERRATTGLAATEALEQLGIGPTIPAQPAGPGRTAERPEIPAQPGPADAAGR